MPNWSGGILTTKGQALQAKVDAGQTTLTLTKMKIGSGTLPSGQNLQNLNDLVAPQMNVPISAVSAEGNTSTITGVITNAGLTNGFNVRELGVFAQDPALGEILYSITTDSAPDYLPPEGGSVTVSSEFSYHIAVSNAANVAAVLDSSGLVTVSILQQHKHDGTVGNGPKLTANNIVNTLITGLGTKDVQSTLEAIFSESKKKSGSIRNAVVTGPVSTSGMANVLRDRYSGNLCVGGTPISSGDAAGYPINLVFDGILTNSFWKTSLTGSAVNGAAYAGYNFPTAKHIRKVLLLQAGGGSLNYVTSVKVQNSTTGSDWTDVGIFPVVPYSIVASIYLPQTQAAPYWRVLANSVAADNTTWHVHEIEMYELLNPELTNSDIIIQPNALVAFAAGFDLINKQPLDYWELTQQMSLTLEAADGYTVPLSYTNDLCNGGTAISSGDKTGLDGNGAKELAFNNNDNNQSGWRSLQVYNAISGVAYIGYKFATARHIRKARLVQPTATENVSSVKIQFSDEGTTWTTVGTYAVTGGENYLVFPDVGAHQYWRFLANSNASTVSWYWVVSEIEMYEALQTHYVYLTRDANGNVTVGSTRNKPRTVKPVSAASIITQPGYYTTDLCNGGTAISGGDFPNSGAALGYDGILDGTHQWQSAQNAANQNGVSWLGYNFGEPKTIRKIKVIHNTNTNNSMPSVLVQKSADGTTWSDVLTAIGLTTNENIISIPAGYTAQYWRMLAQSSLPSGSTWAILDAEMMEYVESATSNSSVQTDDTIYSDNLCTGGAASASSIFSTYYPQNAFDGNSNTWWESNNPGGSGDAIACDLGVARHIRRLVLDQSADGTMLHYMSSVKVQRCTDGVNWVDVYTANGLSGGKNIINLPANTPSRFWRVLANSQTSGGASYLWCVTEITMHEISNDINLYDPYTGVSKHYDGNTWDTVNRVFVGEAIVDSTGNIVRYTTYPYNKTKLKALPAEDSDDVVTLEQFTNLLASSGWQMLPGGLILQWGTSPAFTGTLNEEKTATFPIAFPNACIKVLPVCVTADASGANVGIAIRSYANNSVKLCADSIASGTNISPGTVMDYIAIGY